LLSKKELFVSYQEDFAPRKIVDLKSEEQNLKNINPWTDMEKCIFFDRFLLFPKDFKKIASFLRNKTTMDCVAFYYDAKKSLPFKGALREHLLRKRRGRSAENCNISWMATVQAAISAGASVSEGDGSDERPFTFSIPGGDNTYSTSKFHPMQRDILDLASDYSVTASCRSESINPSENGSSFISDDLNLKLASCKAPSTVAAVRRYQENDDSVVVDDYNACNASKYDAAVGTKKRQRTPEVKVSGTGNQLVRTSLFETVHEGNALTEAESSTEVTQKPEQLHMLKTSTVVGAGSRKGAHKWAPEEKRIFFETLQQHGM
jgi:nuclear receptor co-repressor 1